MKINLAKTKYQKENCDKKFRNETEIMQIIDGINPEKEPSIWKTQQHQR